MDYREKLQELFGLASLELSLPDDSQTEWISLTDSMISILKQNGNSCDDWSRVKAVRGVQLQTVWDCVFSGEVHLALIPSETAGHIRKPLLRGCHIEDTVILPGCRIEATKLLRNLHIGESSEIVNCGRISFKSGSLCGCGIELELGVETGERNVRSFPCLDVSLAASLSGGHDRSANLEEYGSFLDKFLSGQKSIKSGLIGEACRIKDTSVIEDCLIGSHVSISNACAVKSSTLLGGELNPSSVGDGALVRNSILKWGSRVDSMAIVVNSIVGEASVVEKHGKLTGSLLGPNSVLGEGEITASLAGPFTAAHHQSLLIAARWPEGRGNIGYGANVGSNHTSRLPDQEVRPGEGMFFGLACSVKFPADYSLAPYSIIATGVTTLPQRVEFPFSLICEPFSSVDGIPPAYNQIIPAWVLSDNLFAVRRNEKKYASRNRAKHWSCDSMIIREDTVRMMISALDKLEIPSIKEIYSNRDIDGLGKNYLTEAHRLKAIETYRFHVRLFALNGLPSEGGSAGTAAFITDIVKREFPGTASGELLEIRSEMRSTAEESIRSSRMKDHSRGSRIIADYACVRDLQN